MNQDMLYSMFFNSINKMSDKELAESLEKAKSLLSESDYEKLVEFINKNRKN